MADKNNPKKVPPKTGRQKFDVAVQRNIKWLERELQKNLHGKKRR